MANPVAQFRSVFEAGLKSGKYDAPAIDVVQAVKALAKREQLVDALDVYCALFDPARPPQSRSSVELCRTTGYNLFVRALELASEQNDLLELVQSLPSQSKSGLKDAQLAKRLPLYRKRYEALSANDKGDLQRRAKSLAGDRAAEASRRRYLLDDLEKEFRNKNAGRAPAPGELLSFNEWPREAYKEFERLAIACEAALFPKKSGIAGASFMGQFIAFPGAKPDPKARVNGAVVAQNAQSAFSAFAAFLEQQIQQPLDLFRLLAWARQPSPRLYTKYGYSAGRGKIQAPTSMWGGVWEELYQDIVARGLVVAVTQWMIPQMMQARGYVGKDLEFILAPLDEHWTELFRGKGRFPGRLPDAFKPREFADAQMARRRAKAWGDAKGLEILDEVQAQEKLKEFVDDFKADPLGVLSRTVLLAGDAGPWKRTMHLFQAEEDVFTVTWIPKQDPRSQVCYINVHALPGYIFKAWGNFVGMRELLEDKVYADLAANAAALTQLLLAYLMVVGLALDIITAGSSGGLRVVLFRFIEIRLKDMVAQKALDVAGIENPYVRTLVGMAAGMTPSAIKAPGFKGLEELEREAQNVLVAGAKLKPKAQAEAGAGSGSIAPPGHTGSEQPKVVVTEVKGSSGTGTQGAAQMDAPWLERATQAKPPPPQPATSGAGGVSDPVRPRYRQQGLQPVGTRLKDPNPTAPSKGPEAPRWKHQQTQQQQMQQGTGSAATAEKATLGTATAGPGTGTPAKSLEGARGTPTPAAPVPPGNSSVADTSFSLTARQQGFPTKVLTAQTEAAVGRKLELATGLQAEGLESPAAKQLREQISSGGTAAPIARPVLLKEPVVSDPRYPSPEDTLGSAKPDYLYLTPGKVEAFEVTVDKNLSIVPQVKGMRARGETVRLGDPHKQIQVRKTLGYLVRRYPDSPIVYNIQTYGDIPTGMLDMLKLELEVTRRLQGSLGANGAVQIVVRGERTFVIQ